MWHGHGRRSAGGRECARVCVRALRAGTLLLGQLGVQVGGVQRWERDFSLTSS